MLKCISNSLYTREMPKFHHDKAFDSAMVDKFEITSCKYLGITFIKIVGFTSLGNCWIAILILSGGLELCIKRQHIPKTFPKVESESQKFLKEDPGL